MDQEMKQERAQGQAVGPPLEAGPAEQAGQQDDDAPWSPFPVSSETYYTPSTQELVLRFPSRASLDQCLGALRSVSARTLGPCAGPFGEMLDRIEGGAERAADYEARFEGEPYYTTEDARCAAIVPNDDVAPLLRYLMDLAVLLDAGCAFGPEGGEDS